MRTGLYNKTKVLVIVIIAIIAFMGITAVGVGASQNPQQLQACDTEQKIVEEVADNGKATKEFIISNIELFGVHDGKKVYDKKTDIAVLNSEKPTLDDVSLDSITCTASSENVGQVTLIYTAVLRGEHKDDYTPVIQNSITSIEITPAPIKLAGVVAATRIYDKSTNVALTGGALQGVIQGDNVGFSLDAVGTVESKDVGTKKAVTYSAELTGDQSANYTMELGNVNATITKAPLEAVWGALTFEYNKTQHKPTVALEGALDGESVTAEALFNKTDDCIKVVPDGGSYNVGLTLSGNDKDNYAVLNASAKVVITPRVAEVEFGGGDTFIGGGVKLSDITATVTNALEGDVVTPILAQANESRPGRHTALVVGLNNANYKLSDNVPTKSYVVRAPFVSNYATTAKKLTIDIIDEENGFDPNAIFYVERIEESKAVFDKLKKEEKFYSSYKMRMTIGKDPIDQSGTFTYSLTIPATDKSEAQSIKIALFDGTSTKVLDLDIVDGKVVFEATNLLEISIAIVYAPIFVWLWAILGILAVVVVIVALWMVMFLLGKRKLVFDPNGGEPVEGISGKFNQEVALPQTTRDSHMFNGWFKDKKLKNEIKLEKMPFWDTIVFAKWLDADGVPTPYVPGSTILPAARESIAPIQLGNEIDKQNESVMRTITFDVRGGLPIPPINLTKGATVEMPMPNKSNDAFAGWYLDDKFKAEARLSIMPKKSLTVYAKWSSDIVIKSVEPLTIKVDKSDKTRTLTFDTRGGNPVSSIVAVKKSKIDAQEPTKIGETFAYWSTDSKDITKKIKLDVMPTSDLTVYAVYSSDLNPKGVAITDEAKRNEALAEPTERKAYNPQEFTRSTGVPSAVDDKIDALMFGKAVMPSTRPLVDQARQNAEAQPKPQVVAEQTRPTVEVTKKATIETVDAKEDKQSLQDKLLVKALLFNTRGGAALKPLQAKMGVPIELPTAIKGESKFLGWYKDESLLKPCDFNKMPSKNTMLFAKWIEDATVQELFDSGLAEGGKNNKAFTDDQARIEKMFGLDEQGIDDIIIQRSTTKKSSMLIDDSKKNTNR